MFRLVEAKVCLKTQSLSFSVLHKERLFAVDEDDSILSGTFYFKLVVVNDGTTLQVKSVKVEPLKVVKQGKATQAEIEMLHQNLNTYLDTYPVTLRTATGFAETVIEKMELATDYLDLVFALKKGTI